MWESTLNMQANHLSHTPPYSAFTLATSELSQTYLILFLKADTSTTTGTSQIPVTLLVSAFKNKIKSVWPSSEVASVNAL